MAAKQAAGIVQRAEATASPRVNSSTRSAPYDWLSTAGYTSWLLDAEKCADGIQALRHYRYEVEEAKSDPAGGHIALSKVPRHDWASHSADAFRTAAVMIREPERKNKDGEAAASGQVIALELRVAATMERRTNYQSASLRAR